MPLRLCLVGAGHMGRDPCPEARRHEGRETYVHRGRGQGGCRGRPQQSTASPGPSIPAMPWRTGCVQRSSHRPPIPITPSQGSSWKTASTSSSRSPLRPPRGGEEADRPRRQKGVRPSGGPPRAFQPAVPQGKGRHQKPLLIEAHRIGPFTGRSTDIDVVHDLMIHDIDLVLSLVKDDIKRLTARGAPVLTEKIDVAHARIEFAGGCVATLNASRVSMARERVFRVHRGRPLVFARPGGGGDDRYRKAQRRQS